MTRVSRAASTTSTVMASSWLMLMSLATWPRSRSMRRKLAAGEAGDGQRCFTVGWMFGIEGEPEFGPVQRQHGRHVVGVQWPVLMGECEPAVQLWVAGELPFESGHHLIPRRRDATVKHAARKEDCRRPGRKFFSTPGKLSAAAGLRTSAQPRPASRKVRQNHLPRPTTGYARALLTNASRQQHSRSGHCHPTNQFDSSIQPLIPPQERVVKCAHVLLVKDRVQT